MSASDIPYHLRTQKNVDRRLFLNLLNRFERYRSLDRYAYISMGAYPLEDHKLLHRQIGITRLIAFDADNSIVDRQKFNRPASTCHCVCKKSGNVIDELDSVLTEADAADCSGIIFWLDYTAPKKIGEQFREFQTLLQKLTDGDIVRITVNSHPPTLGEARQADGSIMVKSDLHKKRLENLKSRIGDFLTNDVSADDMTSESLPIVLARALGQAAVRALPPSGGLGFFPLSIVRYADGQQMLSATGVLCARDTISDLWNQIEVLAWPFGSRNWRDVHELRVKDLTLRERLVLDHAISSDSYNEIREKLGFSLGDNAEFESFLENYKDFYRFYPTLLASEL